MDTPAYDENAARRNYIVDYCFIGQLPLEATCIYKGERLTVKMGSIKGHIGCQSESVIKALPVNTLVVNSYFNELPIDVIQLGEWRGKPQLPQKAASFSSLLNLN